jgi:hypothetical protein
MRSQMTTEKPNLHQALGGEVRPASSYPAEVSPNSSTVVAVTVLADLLDVLAVLRTAALLARNFKTKLSVDVLGMKNFVISPADDLHQVPVQKMLDPIQTYLRELMTSGTRAFVLEANFTTASFLTVGSIALRVRTEESAQRT